MYEPSRRLDEVHLSITDDQLIVCVYDSGLGEEDLDEDETLQNRAFLIHLDSAEHVFELNPPVEFCDVLHISIIYYCLDAMVKFIDMM